MNIPVYQINAFINKVFAGNPAAVCPLEKWLEDSVLQAVAKENNLSETAFFIKEKNSYQIRWFSPITEVDLCGHATLASAFVIFNNFEKSSNQISFHSRSGKLVVVREDNNLLSMNFPSRPAKACWAPENLLEGFNIKPLEVLSADDYLVVFANESDIEDLKPDMEKLKQLDLRGVSVTAPGNEADFVSRFFAPKFGIDEDPVTGVAHCTLVPYWSGKLGKKDLHAYQISQRGGELFCRDLGDRIIIAGRAVKVSETTITI